MAKVTTRKETGKLVIDFTYRGVRCREQTALPDTAANRRRVNKIVEDLKNELSGGTFEYARFFPGSRLAERFGSVAPLAAPPDRPPVAQAVTAALNPRQTPLFSAYAEQWVKAHEVEWRRSNLRNVRSLLDGRLLPRFGEKPVSAITKADIYAFRADLAKLAGRKGNATLSNKRVNNIIGCLRQILNEAAEEFDFPSPVATLKPLRVRRSDVQPFSLDEVEKMLATVRPDYRDYLLVRFFTGMRSGEADGLKWKYVDFDKRLILIREALVLGEDDYTKTDSSQREIEMRTLVYEALKRQEKATRSISEYVFCNREGNPVDNKNFTERVWYPLLRHLGLAPRRPYQMRHTAATVLVACGESPDWIARQLGHANTQMLFSVYSRFVPNLTRQDGSAMERLLRSKFDVSQPTSGEHHEPVV